MDTVAAVQFRCTDEAAARAGGRLDAVRAAVRGVFDKIESLLDALNPGSELSRLAPLDDAAILAKCDPFVKPCYEAAFRMRDATDGAFDPRWRGPGTMDLGAIAKGFAVDLAADAAKEAGIPDGVDLLIDLGGNLKAVKGAWRTAIAGTGETILLEEGRAVATSAKYFRGDHVKDARTGESARGSAYSVSVVDPSSAMFADALSTALFILPADEGYRFLAGFRPAARVIRSGAASPEKAARVSSVCGSLLQYRR